MDKLKSLQAELETARDALTALQDELPQFHALLTENERDAQRLKTERAPLDAQAQARGRVQIAKEMLEQHQSDIQSARAEVARHEALHRRELILKQMATHAQGATKHREALEKTVHETSAALGEALEVMLASFKAIYEERQAFALLGRELAPEFDGREPFNTSIQGQARRAVCEAVLIDLEARGVTLTDVLNTATGKHTKVDRNTRPLPNPEHAHLLWEVFNEVVAKRNRGIFYSVYLPVKPQPVSVLGASTSADPYQL